MTSKSCDLSDNVEGSQFKLTHFPFIHPNVLFPDPALETLQVFKRHVLAPTPFPFPSILLRSLFSIIFHRVSEPTKVLFDT